ncbi:MAG: hypothetical protein ABS918_12645 [Saccharopolyspora rectivirgula]
MPQPTPLTSTAALVAGIATASALSAAAVVAVLNAGCDDPGSYRWRGGAVELVGGCLQPEDLPVVPQPAEPTAPPVDIPAQ